MIEIGGGMNIQAWYDQYLVDFRHSRVNEGGYQAAGSTGRRRSDRK
jgi:hypothetical protein